jgi:hypothetical protein
LPRDNASTQCPFPSGALLFQAQCSIMGNDRTRMVSRLHELRRARCAFPDSACPERGEIVASLADRCAQFRKKFVEGHLGWIDNQTVSFHEGRCRMGNSVGQMRADSSPVPGNVCVMPIASRTWQHEDAIRHQCDP